MGQHKRGMGKTKRNRSLRQFFSEVPIGGDGKVKVGDFMDAVEKDPTILALIESKFKEMTYGYIPTLFSVFKTTSDMLYSRQVKAIEAGNYDLAQRCSNLSDRAVTCLRVRCVDDLRHIQNLIR
jgi:hypothetical protein